MAVQTNSNVVASDTSNPAKVVTLAIDFPRNPGLRLNLHLTVLAKSLVLFVTSTSPESATSATPMGSFVFAMPDRYEPRQPMSTSIYSNPSTMDFATRLAKVLVRRVQKPCYVGSSINLSSTAGGGTVDEEMEAFRAVVDAVVSQAST